MTPGTQGKAQRLGEVTHARVKREHGDTEIRRTGSFGKVPR
jgi:hypothetical protein